MSVSSSWRVYATASFDAENEVRWVFYNLSDAEDARDFLLPGVPDIYDYVALCRDDSETVVISDTRNP